MKINNVYYLFASIVALITIWKALQAWRFSRVKKSSNYNETDFKRVTSIYIKPNAIDMDPCEAKDFRYTHGMKESIFSFVDRLFDKSTEKYNILLADSGMGKTAFLLNYFVRHYQIFRWKKYKIYLFPLGAQRNQPNQDLEQFIQSIPKEERNQGVLFLDAFDEDPKAIDNHHDRLIQIVKLTSEFRSVLITCRTQFFAKDEEIPKETGIVKVICTNMNESKTYLLYKFYIAPFDERQVAKYIYKKYPFFLLHLQKTQKGSFKQDKRSQLIFWPHRRAWKVINKINDLRFRPMVLTYIDYLMKVNNEMNSRARIYEAIVNGWLERESPIVDKEKVRTFCEKMAIELFEKYPLERIPFGELAPLAKQFGIDLPHWQLSGRSLLNRDAAGNYKFAHRSIMEYLYACQIIKSGIIANEKAWNSELLILSFVIDMAQQNIVNAKSNQMLNLINADLTGIDLLVIHELKTSGVKLAGVKYNGIEFMRQIERLKMPMEEWTVLLESFEEVVITPKDPLNPKRKAYDILAKQLYHGPDGNSFTDFKDFQQFMASIAYDLLTSQYPIKADNFNEYCQKLADSFSFSVAASHELT
ncbi:MAG TPA: hypothetical protein VHY08_17870, partial [Bacillota bacterium]|nr:hypothetical protein [Bacillota bacterium]